MAESENQLELKKRARRRLVGAIALALTAAVILPMVMDHEPKPLTQDIQIRIPNPDAASVSRPAALRQAPESDAGKPRPAPAAEASTPAAKPSEPEAAKPDSAPRPPQQTQTKPETAKAAAEAKPDARSESKADPKAGAKNEAKPEAKAEAKPAAKAETGEGAKAQQDTKAEREAKVEAILSGSEPAQASGQFIVQLGAFGDPANVTKIRARVREAGFSSYTEVLKGSKGNQTRVRAGPFASREAAEQAAAKLKHAGLAGLVAPK